MSSVSNRIISTVKKSLKLLEEIVEAEPILLIDAEGKHWINDRAQSFFKKSGIVQKDFVEWLKIGASHLQNLHYLDINIHMMKLPGGDVIVFFRPKQRKAGSKAEEYKITQREREVLRYLVKGFSNKKIADSMKISSGTVNGHLDSIYLKLGCTSRLAAGFIALKNGLFLPVCKSAK